MAIDAALIQRQGWRQGSIFTLEASRPVVIANRERIAVPGFVIDDRARLLVTSQDCDVVHPGPHEPRVEVCPAVLVRGGLDGNFTGTRNPRRLQIELNIRGARFPCEVRAPTRFCIDRAILEASAPDPEAQISPRHQSFFVHWLAKRFRRAALPTAFDQRVSKEIRSEIRGLLRPLEDSIDSMLIAIDPEDRELEKGVAYLVQIVALMEESDFVDPVRREPVEAAIRQVQGLLDQCEDIELDACVVESSGRMTVEEYREFDVWDYDELSLEAGTEPPRAAP